MNAILGQPCHSQGLHYDNTIGFLFFFCFFMSYMTLVLDSRLGAVRTMGSCKASRTRADWQCLFVIFAYASANRKPDTEMGRFYQHFYDIVRTVLNWTLLVVFGPVNVAKEIELVLIVYAQTVVKLVWTYSSIFDWLSQSLSIQD